MSQESELREFIAECCEVGFGRHAASSELYQMYGEWCFANKRRPLNVRQFKTAMENLGFFHKRFNWARVFTGIAPKPSDG